MKETENALDKDGLMHFTPEQVDTINLYRRTQKYDASVAAYNRKRVKIINMHMAR